MSPEFAEYQKQILKNAQTVVEELVKRGYKIVSGMIVLLFCSPSAIESWNRL